MPKIRSYTPAWLCKPSPGHDLFAPSPSDAPKRSSLYSSARPNVPSGPRKTIARRGTEVFVAVGKEIRWADLVYLKERWQEKESRDHDGVRIKREGAPAPAPEDDDVLEASVENGFAEGFRVSWNYHSLTTALSHLGRYQPRAQRLGFFCIGHADFIICTCYRRSRHPSAVTSNSSLSRHMPTSWLSLPPIPFASSLYPILHISRHRVSTS